MCKWLNTTVLIHTPETVDQPCHELGWCPYGQLVEEYPFYPEAEVLAMEHDMWVKFNEVAHTIDGRNYRGGWQKCAADDPDATADINGLLIAELLDTTMNCDIFGHQCPVYYMAEFVPKRGE